MEIVLKKPTIEYAKEIMKFCKEIFKAEDEDFFARCGMLEKCEMTEE